MSDLEDWIDHRDEAIEHRLRRLGTRTPSCQGCGEADPLALTGVSPQIHCHACAARAAGRRDVERHHVAGRANDPDDLVEIPINDHRWLSTHQQHWPTETLRNPTGSPLLRAAAAIRGWLEVLLLIIDRTVGWIPPFLEWLDQALTEAHGPEWWLALGWDTGTA